MGWRRVRFPTLPLPRSTQLSQSPTSPSETYRRGAPEGVHPDRDWNQLMGVFSNAEPTSRLLISPARQPDPRRDEIASLSHDASGAWITLRLPLMRGEVGSHDFGFEIVLRAPGGGDGLHRWHPPPHPTRNLYPLPLRARGLQVSRATLRKRSLSRIPTQQTCHEPAISHSRASLRVRQT